MLLTLTSGRFLHCSRIASVLSGAGSVIGWPFDRTMIGQTLDHYRILVQIGEGGMGVVYRARDEVLNRDVAQKLLAHGALEKVGPGHLLREAQTASSLSHHGNSDALRHANRGCTGACP